MNEHSFIQFTIAMGCKEAGFCFGKADFFKNSVSFFIDIFMFFFFFLGGLCVDIEKGGKKEIEKIRRKIYVRSMFFLGFKIKI